LDGSQIPIKPTCNWEDPVAIYQSLLVGEEKEEEESIECNCFDNIMDDKYARLIQFILQKHKHAFLLHNRMT
jgi:hypothetical protein